MIQLPAVNPALQFSRWVSLSFLIDSHEMEHFLNSLLPFMIFPVSGILQENAGEILMEEFLDTYANYITSLKEGKLPEDPRFARLFSSVFTTTLDALYEVKVSPGRKVIKPALPVVQLQRFRFNYSEADHRFHPMTMGQNSLQWGLQLSYPGLFQKGDFSVSKVRTHDDFPNTPLFKKCQKWVREHTVPVPFIVGGKVVNVPFRLGKDCFEWIDCHPQLAQAGLKIHT